MFNCTFPDEQRSCSTQIQAPSQAEILGKYRSFHEGKFISFYTNYV